MVDSRSPEELSGEEIERLLFLQQRLLAAAKSLGVTTEDGVLALDYILHESAESKRQLKLTRKAVEDIQTSIPSVLTEFFPHQSFDSSRVAMNQEIQRLVNRKFLGAIHPSTGPITFS